jgi:hypothetical protein
MKVTFLSGSINPKYVCGSNPIRYSIPDIISIVFGFVLKYMRNVINNVATAEAFKYQS